MAEHGWKKWGGTKDSKQEKQVMHTCRLHSAILSGEQHGDWL